MSPTQRFRHVGGDVAGELEAFFGGAKREHAAGVADRLAQLEWPALDLQPSRFDLREVQDIVDHLEQRVGGRLDGRQVVALLGRQARLQRERRHAEDRVERRPDLVAHVREERALGRRSIFRAVLGHLELFDEPREPCRLIVELAVRDLEILRVA